MSNSARKKLMSQANFEALRQTLHAAAETMSREQIIQLADDLFDCSRERRDLRSWRSHSGPSAQTN